MADRTRSMMGLLVLVWGTAFVSIKVLGEVLSPIQLTWFRYVPFLALFGPWLLLRRMDRFARVSGADWLRFTLAGILGVLGYHLPLNFATSTLSGGTPITGGMAAVLVATTPLWTLLWLAVRGNRPTARVISGALVAFIGVALVVFMGRPDADGPRAAWKGLVGILAPVLWSGYNIVAKPLADRYGGLFTAGLTNGIGTLMLLPVGISYGVAPVLAMSGWHLFWLAYLSLAATVGGYIMWNHGLKRLGPAKVTSYIFAIPVVATAAGAILIQEPITLWFLAGAGLVLFGLWRVQVPRQQGA